MKRRYILIAIVLLFFVVEAFFYSSQLAWFLEGQLEKTLGRKTSIEKVELDLWDGEIELSDFKLFEQDSQTVFMSFDKLDVKLDLMSWINGRNIINSIELEEPFIRVYASKSGFNFDDLFDRLNEDNSEEAKQETTEPFRIELKDIEIEEGVFSYSDGETGDSLELKNIALKLPEYISALNAISNLEISFELATGGTFHSVTDLNLNTGLIKSESVVSNVDLSPFSRYAKDLLNFSSWKGFLNTEIALVSNLNEYELTSISGQAGMKAFSLLDLTDQEVLGMDSLLIDLSTVKPLKSSFEIESINCYGPRMRFEFEDSTSNLHVLASPMMQENEGDTLQVEENVEAVELAYSIGQLMVQDAYLKLIDKRFEKEYEYNISDIRFETSKLTESTDSLRINTSAKLNDKGNVVAQLSINPQDPYELDLEYTISDFELSDLNFYSKKYTGFPIFYGQIYYYGHNTIQDKKIVSDNKIKIYRVELGKREKDGSLYDMPLKLALAILKDDKGNIEIDLPMRGDMNDPDYNINKLIWGTAKNLIVRAVKSPFKKLSNLVKADPEDIKSFDFELGEADLTKKHARSANLLKKVLEKRPELEFELIYYKDTVLENRYLQEKRVANAILQDSLAVQNEMEALVTTDSLAEDGSNSEDKAISSIIQLMNGSELDSMRLDGLSNMLDSLGLNMSVRRSKMEHPKNVGSEPHFEVRWKVKEE
ncbi:DUF748 domain-containing protein [Aureibacter tunicatorum]|uniref:DUF748 domain-containing protein n=1 Tax=Aureibacter tunicatorum TaxID=866807 RepID=A0AAE4BQ81_9BACT|nr:DUF748 domain-containing protein [Aureibacter tunicatorum]MDR6238824.1 hypothetical protein [Aureibacter tunicatorum]BDD05249.1 hypothetical protein AUTU_27320 [Aureibacter tunicatorum]